MSECVRWWIVRERISENCKGKSKDSHLHVHHIIFRRTGITSNLAKKYLNLIDYCLKNLKVELDVNEFITILKSQNINV